MLRSELSLVLRRREAIIFNRHLISAHYNFLRSHLSAYFALNWDNKLTIIPPRLTHFTDPAARALVAAAKRADQASDEEDEKPKGKGKGKGRAKASAKKGKPAPKPKPETKVKKEEYGDDEYEGDEEDEDEGFEDAFIASKRG